MADRRSSATERTPAEFDRLRPYLLRVAYSHLGSLSEAEDLVQEAWFGSRAPTAPRFATSARG